MHACGGTYPGTYGWEGILNIVQLYSFDMISKNTCEYIDLKQLMNMRMSMMMLFYCLVAKQLSVKLVKLISFKRKILASSEEGVELRQEQGCCLCAVTVLCEMCI